MASRKADFDQSDTKNGRQHPRVDVDLRTDFRIIHPRKEQGNISVERAVSYAKTLGEGGLMFISNVPLSVGTKVDMRLYYYSLIIEFVAEVVWQTERSGFGTSEFLCGSKYAAISYDNFAHIHNIVTSLRTH